MKQTVPMTELPGSCFNDGNSVERMAEALDLLLSGELPAFVIRQAGGSVDLLTREALGAIGWDLIARKSGGEVDVGIGKSLATFGINSRHIERGGYSYYPKDRQRKGIVVRGHDALSGSARVEMKTAEYKEVGSPSHRLHVFTPTRNKPTHVTIQNPGDRVMFVVYGGVLNDTVICPAQHDFERVRLLQAQRTVRTTDFEVLPA